jgi:hypothetical protein
MRPPWLLPVALGAGVLAAAGCALDQKGLGASTHPTPAAEAGALGDGGSLIPEGASPTDPGR